MLLGEEDSNLQCLKLLKKLRPFSANSLKMRFTAAHLHQFLVEEQKEKATVRDAQAIINSIRHVIVFHKSGLNLEGFFKYLFGDLNPPLCPKRESEFLIAFLVLTIAACFLVELGHAKPQASEVLHGLFVPQLKGDGATGLAISLLGAMVMPHNLFLHSALVLSRKIPRSVGGIKLQIAIVNL